jgi:hypothetical protein
VTDEDCKRILRKALSLRTTANVNRYLGEELQQIAPGLSILDTI